MIKRLLKDSGIYGIAGLLTRGISLLLVPFYTQVFSPGDYGAIDILAMAASILNIIIGMEITQAIARFYPDCTTKREAQEYASTALFFTVAVFTSLLVTGLIFSGYFSEILLENKESKHLFQVALFGIALQGCFTYVQNLLRWRLEPKAHSACSLVFSFGTICTTVVLVLYFHTGVIGVFWGQITGGLLGLALGLYLCRSSFIPYFNVAKLKDMLAYSFPLVPSGIGVFALTFADRISIKSMMSLHALGIFGIGYRMSSVVGIVMGAFSGALTPLIFSKFREESTPSEIAKIFRYFLFAALIFISFVTIFSKEIIALLTTEEYYPAAEILPYLVIAGFLSGMYIFTPGLDIEKKTKYYALINISGVILNLGLNIILIPMVGILGAAVATLASSLVTFLTIFYFSQRYYYVPHDIKPLLLTTALCCIIALLGKSVEFSGGFNVVTKLLFLLCSIVVGWKFLNIKEIQILNRVRSFVYPQK